MEHPREHIDGLVQDCSNSIAKTLEFLQLRTKSSISRHTGHTKIERHQYWPHFAHIRQTVLRNGQCWLPFNPMWPTVKLYGGINLGQITGLASWWLHARLQDLQCISNMISLIRRHYWKLTKKISVVYSCVPNSRAYRNRWTLGRNCQKFNGKTPVLHYIYCNK